MIRLFRQSDKGLKEVSEQRYKDFKEVFHRKGWRVLAEGEEAPIEEVKEVKTKEKPTPKPPVKEEPIEIERVDELEEVKPKKRGRKKKETNK